MRKLTYLFCLCSFVFLSRANAGDDPAMLCYSVMPNAFFNEQATQVAKLYDGFFYTIGSWDEGVKAHLGIGDATPAQTDWKHRTRENLVHLTRAGVTENLLGVSFSDSAPWPSSQTLLSPAYTTKMEHHFASIGKSAKELGFRGVSIDVEYPFPRYCLEHEIYGYENYTADDLIRAASNQGRAVMSALLNEFPEAVIMILPGDLWGQTLERSFVNAMIEEMAVRDAPGGCHMGAERSYCLLDPVSLVAIPRVADCVAPVLLSKRSADYWKRRCTVAPGVWPLHKVETTRKDYPIRSWTEELNELRQQMGILRKASKRYIWSFSISPVWYVHTPEIENRYGLPPQSFDGVQEVIPGWQDILSKRDEVCTDPMLLQLMEALYRFDREEIDAVQLCESFGTPGDWLVLGLLGNPFTTPRFAACDAFKFLMRPDLPFHGRDGVVRWFPYPNREPLGSVRAKAAFDWRRTDDSSAHFVSWVSATEELHGFLNIGWDDGVIVNLENKEILNRAEYPEKGHGLLFRDRFNFEETIPIHIPAGKSLLAVTSINSHGSWGFNIRFTDALGYPLEGIHFSLN